MKTLYLPKRRPLVAALTLKVTYRSIDDLSPNAGNPRQHSDKQIRQIAKSIETFGFLVPVLVDEAGGIIAGHGRLLAARGLGLDVVPTVSISHLTEGQKRAYLIADNKLAINASWNEQLLTEQFAALAAVDLDFSSDVTGFELPEIDLILQSEPDATQPDPDDAPLALSSTVSRVGDIWQLGDHRVVCGSALDAAVYSALMGDERATMVFSDSPYNVPIGGHVSGLGKNRHREFLEASGEMSRQAFADFLRGSYELMVRYSEDGSLHYVCCDWRHVGEFLDAAEGLYTAKNLAVWDKGTGGMGSLYRSQHELIWIFKSGAGAHTNNVQLGRFGRSRTNVWKYPGINSFARSTDEGNLLSLHPTVKPVTLVADAIMDASNRGDIVLDPFLGSGTTAIAAERTGRVARGIELDPIYVDVAVLRWQRQTGRSARHAILPCTFAELAEQREVSHG